MKKTILLTASAMLISAASFAQVKATAVKKNFAPKVQTMQKFEALASRDAQPERANRTAANGVYYSRPVGSLYRTMDKDGMGWSASLLATAPQNPNLFTNMCKNASTAKWSVNGTTVSGDENNNLTFGELGTIEPVSPDGGISYYYVPTISSGRNSYTLGEANDKGAGMRADEVAGHMFYDENTAQNSGFGALDTGYLFGTGGIEFNNEPGVIYQGYGLQETFPTPGYPLYVEDIYTLVYTDGSAPITGDAVLYLTVYDKNKQIITELTATADDVSDAWFEQDIQYTKTGKVAGYLVTFSKKEKDAFGNDVVVPFVLDDEFTVVIEGCNQPGINVGFCGGVPCAEDNLVVGKGALPLITDGEDVYNFSYTVTLSSALIFNSCYDNIEVPTELYSDEEVFENANVLVVSEDGKTAVVESTGIPAVLVSNAFPWYDDDDNENYYISELPDWVTEYAVEDLVDEGERTGLAAVSFAFEPLPAGVKGRQCQVYVEGKGVTSADPIIIIQGDGTAAVENVAADKNTTRRSNKFYNAAGQTISKETKGLIINAAKKFINK